MLNQIDALRSPGGVGGLDSGFMGPAGPFGGGAVGGAESRCGSGGCCGGGAQGALGGPGQPKTVGGEIMKAAMDPVGETARDMHRAKKTGMKAKLAAMKGDLLGAAFYGRLSQNAQKEVMLDLATQQGLSGMAGVGANPLLGV